MNKRPREPAQGIYTRKGMLSLCLVYFLPLNGLVHSCLKLEACFFLGAASFSTTRGGGMTSFAANILVTETGSIEGWLDSTSTSTPLRLGIDAYESAR